jgi:hypothetical protein
MDHELLIQAVRADGLPPMCGARWAKLTLSRQKAAQIAAACEREAHLRECSGANVLLVARRTPVTTQGEVVWLDDKGKALNHRLRLVSRPGPGKRATEIALIQIEGQELYLWNFIGHEKVRTVRLKGRDLVRALEQADFHLPGVQHLRQQLSLT